MPAVIEIIDLFKIYQLGEIEVRALNGVSLSIERDMPLVSVDSVQMERAFVNVLENARRHSGGYPVSVRSRAVLSLAGTPRRQVATGASDRPVSEGQRPARDRVIVRIVDRGPGIPPAQLERVFEPFYRAGTPSGGHRGSGLGLAIARGFAEANGGSLHVESLPGQGATFVFELPLEEPGEEGEDGAIPAKVEPVQAAEQGASSGAGETAR